MFPNQRQFIESFLKQSSTCKSPASLLTRWRCSARLWRHTACGAGAEAQPVCLVAHPQGQRRRYLPLCAAANVDSGHGVQHRALPESGVAGLPRRSRPRSAHRHFAASSLACTPCTEQDVAGFYIQRCFLQPRPQRMFQCVYIRQAITRMLAGKVSFPIGWYTSIIIC